MTNLPQGSSLQPTRTLCTCTRHCLYGNCALVLTYQVVQALLLIRRRGDRIRQSIGHTLDVLLRCVHSAGREVVRRL